MIANRHLANAFLSIVKRMTLRDDVLATKNNGFVDLSDRRRLQSYYRLL